MSLPIYLVSLRSAEARRAALKERFPRSYSRFVNIEAVDGRQLSAAGYFDRLSVSREFLSPSELGCTLSHLLAVETFLKSDSNAALFLEDDVLGSDDAIDAVDRITGQLRDSFVFSCGGQEGLRSNRWLIAKQVPDQKGLYRVPDICKRQVWRTCCYVLSRSAAETIVERQRSMLHRADDWASLAAGSALYFGNFLSHPTELDMSMIEGERRTKPPFTIRSLCQLLSFKAKLYAALLTSVLMLALGYARPLKTRK